MRAKWAVGGLIGVAGTAGVVAAVAVGTAHHRAAPRDSVTARVDSLIEPRPSGVTVDQEIAGLTDPRDSAGVVRGRVISEIGTTLANRLPFTDYAFSIQQVFGPNQFRYSPGSVVTLRVPGGSVSGQPAVVEDEDAPEVSVGEVYYVWVSGGPMNATVNFGGGNTADRIVVELAGRDVWEVHGDQVVGQGYNKQVVKTTGDFERLLHQHDAG